MIVSFIPKVISVMVSLWVLSSLHAGSGKRFVPPLRLSIPFELTWKTMIEILNQEEWKLNHKNRGQGHITTAYREYISGPLTTGHLSKIGIRPRLTDGEWVRIQYRYDLQIELMTARETRVTVDIDIKALKRNYLGREEWARIPSTGRMEQYLLTALGKAIYGEQFSLEKPRTSFLGLPSIGAGPIPEKPPGSGD